MAITAEEIVKKEADALEKEIDGLLAKKKDVIWTHDGKVFLLLSNRIPNVLILEEIIERYIKVGWGDINYEVYEGEYRLIMTPGKNTI